MLRFLHFLPPTSCQVSEKSLGAVSETIRENTHTQHTDNTDFIGPLWFSTGDQEAKLLCKK